jgi:hypothetical protein
MNLFFLSPTCLPLPWHPPPWTFFLMIVISPLPFLEHRLFVQVLLPPQIGLSRRALACDHHSQALGLSLHSRPGCRAQGHRALGRGHHSRPTGRSCCSRLLGQGRPRPPPALQSAAPPRRLCHRPALLPLCTPRRPLPVASRPPGAQSPPGRSPSPPSSTSTTCVHAASLALHSLWIASTSTLCQCRRCRALFGMPCPIHTGAQLCKLSMMH